jgi:alcohol dehydrogenase
MAQKVVIGEGSLGQLHKVLERRDFKNILVVTGTHFEESHFPRGQFHQQQIICVQNGLLTKEVVFACMEKISFDPDAVVAIGGGRILDATKLLLHYAEFPRPFFIAVPTTAGSGSESTPFAVLYEGQTKISVQNNRLLPDCVVLDPQELASLSKFQKAVSGIDAFAQAVESLWNIHASSESRIYADEALKLLWSELAGFVHDEASVRNKKMMWASYLAGRAIAITRTTGCHALSYYLTAKHGIQHGQAVALFLPSFFIYNAEADLLPVYHILGVNNAGEAYQKTNRLIKQCGLATNFREAAIQVDIDELLDSVNEERFANNPVAFERNKLKDLIQQYIC